MSRGSRPPSEFETIAFGVPRSPCGNVCEETVAERRLLLGQGGVGPAQRLQCPDRVADVGGRRAGSALGEHRMRCKPRVQQRDQVHRDGHVLGVCLVLERRLTQILVDVPGALSIGQRGREQPGVSRSTAGNQRPTTPSASPTAGSRRFATTSPDPAHVERRCPSARATDATGAPSTCARAPAARRIHVPRSSRVPAPGRRSREPLEPTRDVAVQYMHPRDGPPLLEVEFHGIPIDGSDAAQHVADSGEPGDRRRIDVRPLAA